jgi:hypothetical protein
MDRALFGDEPLILKFYKVLVASWFFSFEFVLSSEVLHKDCFFVSYSGNPLANMSRAVGNPVGNPLANLLLGVRGSWHLSGKFLVGCQRELATV